MTKFVTIKEIGIKAKEASKELRDTGTEIKNKALLEVQKAIFDNREAILEANKIDLEFAKKKALSEAMLDRLELTNKRLESIINALEEIIALPDPVGKSIAEYRRPNGLLIKRVRTPIGVIGIIFESRPNVTIDAGALCLKSGNSSILRCGSESLNTCNILVDCFSAGLEAANMSKNCVQLVKTRDRSAVIEMLRMTENIDVIVPRGGKNLVKVVQSEARVPVFAHLEGIVHIFVHKDANPEKTREIIINSKLRRPGICGAVECLLIDKGYIEKNGTGLISHLVDLGLDVRVDASMTNIKGTKLATEDDWGKEFLDKSLAVKKVSCINDAITHIQLYGSNHTDCIVTEDDQAAILFFKKLDSAILMRNASTQFADGGEFGLGAEIGIATGKIHARGPVGLEQLTSFKYLVTGTGQVRE